MSATTTPCVAVCASKVRAPALCRATSCAWASILALAVEELVLVAVIARISVSIFFVSAGAELVVAVVVDCVDVDVTTAVVAFVDPPDTTLVTLVTDVGLVVLVVVLVVAILTGSVLAVLVADSVTADVAVVVVVVVVPMFNMFFLA